MCYQINENCNYVNIFQFNSVLNLLNKLIKLSKEYNNNNNNADEKVSNNERQAQPLTNLMSDVRPIYGLQPKISQNKSTVKPLFLSAFVLLLCLTKELILYNPCLP